MAAPFDLKLDADGLLPAVAQDRLTGQIRMVGWMNADAVARTLETGNAFFFSRSRGRLWEKGETSGNRLRVDAVYLDCDADTLILAVDPEGPTCHTGRPTCFFRRLTAEGEVRDVSFETEAFLWSLERELGRRRESSAERSYTKSLLDGGAERIGAKLREESEELAHAIADESDERVASEAADVLYHVLVALQLRRVTLRDVVAVLASRSGQSGHEEKRRRRP